LPFQVRPVPMTKQIKKTKRVLRKTKIQPRTLYIQWRDRVGMWTVTPAALRLQVKPLEEEPGMKSGLFPICQRKEKGKERMRVGSPFWMGSESRVPAAAMIGLSLCLMNEEVFPLFSDLQQSS
jgi:hypothetical protein